ncbi:hypothetical protein C1645_829110 [Glomus cerebriforme]|uniref:Protein kinase domain-containing protein n=1 Tax=Glomus cerebriforme TaxID=658196 RepID=A0A397SLN2_9GLOM|nr:hypothetical protein C1645_829110 [Glomus cerebriforme]
MAPEVIRNEPYTSASDIYSLSMIMWEFSSSISPFNNIEHDHQLSLNPFKRLTIMDLENIISQCLRCVNEYYKLNDENYEGKEIIMQVSSDIDIRYIRNYFTPYIEQRQKYFI